MKSLHNSIGLYLHIPFCEKKCAYCDFYSAIFTDKMLDKYVTALIKEIKKWGGSLDRPIDTIYIGGGTPSLLGNRIEPILKSVYESFKVCEDAEITAEINPNAKYDFLQSAYNIGVNRLSMGVQSGNDDELMLLGRSHTADEAKKKMEEAKSIGFKNISLDLMLCLPKSNILRLKESMDFLISLEPNHISAYMLKIEENTKFYYDSALSLPSEEEQSAQYLYMCDYLEKNGFSQYEISNFSKLGFESRHNLKYWQGEEYLGIGPSAHSFLEGKRFYYERDLKKFISLPSTKFDGLGGDLEERFMLLLRLKKGVELKDFISPIPKVLIKYIEKLKEEGLLEVDNTHISLTPNGMLLSNSIITDITEMLYENI